jgi:uncharacterized surface protein with fasciclin (FAS1) repeats
MTHNKSKYFLILLLAASIFSACKKQWDQRDAIANQQLNVNLYQQIQANGNLSVFAGYLAKVGFDKVLASSKTYTVFAPTNAAISAIDPATLAAIVADTAQLHLFVANHIVNQAYLTTNIPATSRVRTLNGKNVTFTPTTVEDANITSANLYVSNGVLNTIDKALLVKLNISQFVRGLTTVGQLQLTYIKRRDSSYVDTTKATVSSINPTTGKPILVPNTGVVNINKYFNAVAKLDAEDSLYTYIVLTDAGYTNEINKVSKYFATSSADTTINLLSAFNVVKDLAIRGKVLPANLPASLTSVNGVPVPIDQTQIVQTYNASNGIVYVMNAVNFNVANKITPIIVQGEQASFYKQSSGTNQIRLRVDNNGVQYRDLLNNQSTVSGYFAAYKLSNLYTCQYKVSIRAINDTAFTKAPSVTLTAPATAPSGWTQGGVAPALVNDPYVPYNYSECVKFGQITATVNTLGVYTITTAVNYPYKNVPPYFYGEIPQGNAAAGTVVAGQTINVVNGNLNVLKYNSIYMYLVGQTSASANLGTIIADYIKLTPVLQ